MRLSTAAGLTALAALTLSGRPSAQAPELAGAWIGSGTLTNTWVDADDPRIRLVCKYEGKVQPPAVRLTIAAEGALGRLVLDMPSSSESCPPLRKSYQIRAAASGTRVTFSDPAGDRWTLELTDDLLGGAVIWDGSSPNPNEALAVGFRYSPPLRPWDVPLTRLSGKVTLRRATGRGPSR